jgi:hypothetical protein
VIESLADGHSGERRLECLYVVLLLVRLRLSYFLVRRRLAEGELSIQASLADRNLDFKIRWRTNSGRCVAVYFVRMFTGFM